MWCPINPRNEAAENRELLDLFDCTALVYQSAFAPLVASIRDDLPKLQLLVCLDGPIASSEDQDIRGSLTWDHFLGEEGPDLVDVAPVCDVAMIVGTGGTTGRPKGVMLTGRNLETMTALTLIGYPFDGRPVYLALAPSPTLPECSASRSWPSAARSWSCAPLMSAASSPTSRNITSLIPSCPRRSSIWPLPTRPRHHRPVVAPVFLVRRAPMSATRLEEALTRIGPVMAQLFGQTEAPMMISTMSPADHFRADGSIATERLSSAGRPTPLVTTAVMGEDGTILPNGERGEIVVRSSLVMAGLLQESGRNR